MRRGVVWTLGARRLAIRKSDQCLPTYRGESWHLVLVLPQGPMGQPSPSRLRIQDGAGTKITVDTRWYAGKDKPSMSSSSVTTR